MNKLSLIASLLLARRVYAPRGLEPADLIKKLTDEWTSYLAADSEAAAEGEAPRLRSWLAVLEPVTAILLRFPASRPRWAAGLCNWEGAAA
jgi:hypothetical protein